MSLNIIWSPRAETDFLKVCDYLAQEWNITTAINFIDSTEKTLINITRFPFSFPAFDKKKNVRKCVLNKHTTLYYRVRKDAIELITFFQTRQSPGKIKL